MRRPVQRLIAAVATAGVALALVGCGDRTPEDIGATETVFLETCAPGGAPLEVEVCRCAFAAITEGLSAEALERLDRNLRDDPDTVAVEITTAALDCAAEPLTPPTIAATSSTTSTTEKPPESTTTTQRGR